MTLSIWCDYLGTLAFAISGIRLAAGKGLDWFGAYVVGFVTAVGGGTIRDILLDIKPFWLVQPSYLIITALGLIFTIIFRRQVVRLNHSLFVFDAIGLGLFVVVGVAKSYAAGFPWWVAVIMGTVTGSFGGLLRDVLINETPLDSSVQTSTPRPASLARSSMSSWGATQAYPSSGCSSYPPSRYSSSECLRWSCIFSYRPSILSSRRRASRRRG